MLYDALHTTLVFLFNLSKLHESVQGLARLSLHLADIYPTFFLFIPLYIPLHGKGNSWREEFAQNSGHVRDTKEVSFKEFLQRETIERNKKGGKEVEERSIKIHRKTSVFFSKGLSQQEKEEAIKWKSWWTSLISDNCTESGAASPITYPHEESKEWRTVSLKEEIHTDIF